MPNKAGLKELSPKGYVVSCRFHGPLMSVWMSVMLSVVHYEGYQGLIFFLNDLD